MVENPTSALLYKGLRTLHAPAPHPVCFLTNPSKVLWNEGYSSWRTTCPQRRQQTLGATVNIRQTPCGKASARPENWRYHRPAPSLAPDRSNTDQLPASHVRRGLQNKANILSTERPTDFVNNSLRNSVRYPHAQVVCICRKDWSISEQRSESLYLRGVQPSANILPTARRTENVRNTASRCAYPG